MLLKPTLAPTLLLAAHCITKTLACGPLPNHAKRSTSDTDEITYPYPDPGDDTPSNPATTGYFINHLCINVRNVTESIAWYKAAFGLRLIFTLHVSEHFSITYMGHSHGGHNGTGYQTADEMNREKNNREGLIEMMSVSSPRWALPAGIETPNTFSHIGMVVPNITDTQARLEAMGANVLKGYGEETEIDGAFGFATGFTQAGDAISEEEIAAIKQVIDPLNAPLVFVADPDGNIVEIQNQEGSGVV